MTNEERLKLLDMKNTDLSLREQCLLLDVHRSNLYYKPVPVGPERLKVMNAIDEIYTQYPFFGSRRIQVSLAQQGFEVCRERVQSLMRRMGICAIYPKPNLSKKNSSHTIYPYLLNDLVIQFPNQVWSTDVTYIRMDKGFLYLVAILDWYSRYVLSWRLSNTLEIEFCLEALVEALTQAVPDIFNTDQGSQFTSPDYTSTLLNKNIKISMDGKGRALDNIFIERLWRSVKYEEVYLKKYTTGIEAREALKSYFEFYNNKRPHQSLDYKTPGSVYREGVYMN